MSSLSFKYILSTAGGTLPASTSSGPRPGPFSAIQPMWLGGPALAALGLSLRAVWRWRQRARIESGPGYSAARALGQGMGTGGLTYRFDDGSWTGSPAFEAICGLAEGEARELSCLLRLLDHPDLARLRRDIGSAYATGTGFEHARLRIRRMDGQARWIGLQARVVHAAGRPAALLCTVRDLGAGQPMRQEGANGDTAWHDCLTGLPNRRMLAARLASLQQARPHGAALMLVDLDHFRILNESCGRDRGDLLLCAVAARLRRDAGPASLVARMGADQFLVLAGALPATAAEAHDAAAALAEKLRASLADCYDVGGLRYACTASIGVAMVRPDQADCEHLIDCAKSALLLAKRSGRNLVRFHDPSTQAAETARVALSQDLRMAVDGGQFELHYQVQVDADGCPSGAEALVRWRHPQRGLVPPALFIPLCEATRLILPLGRWVLETACAQLAAWTHDPQLAGLTMSVNVSACQIKEPGFVGEVKAALRHSGVEACRLKLELTEGTLLEDTAGVIATMRELKAAGVAMSLDDFGTGYSSLAYLKRLPIDQLKIDQTFVRDLLTDSGDVAIVRAIVALGESFGIGIIAEGVETEAQRALLAGAGCRAYQGYLFGRPMPPAAFEDSVRTQLHYAAARSAGRDGGENR